MTRTIAITQAEHVAQVIACDGEGGRWPSNAWPEPCELSAIVSDLDDAVAGRFTLPDA